MSTEVTAAPVPAAESGTEKSSGNLSVEGLSAFLNKTPEVPAEAATEQAPAPAAPVEGETPTEALPEGEAKPAEGEQPAEAQAPAEGEPTEGDLSQEDAGFDDEAKARISNIVKKRLAKEKAKQDALQQELAQAQAQAQAAAQRVEELVKVVETARPVPTYVETPNDPVAKIDNLNDLHAKAVEARKALREVEAILDDGVPEEGVSIGDQKFSRSDLTAIKRNAQRQLEESIPQRAQFLQARQAWGQKVAGEFTYLSDKNSPDYVKHMAAYQSLPMLRSLPNADYIIGAVLAYEKSKAAAGKPAAAPAKPKVPASQAAPSAAPATRTREPGDVGGKREVEKQKQAILKKGNLTTKDAAALFALR